MNSKWHGIVISCVLYITVLQYLGLTRNSQISTIDLSLHVNKVCLGCEYAYFLYMYVSIIKLYVICSLTVICICSIMTFDGLSIRRVY